MPTRRPQSKNGDGSEQPNVVDEPGRDGAPQVLRDGGGGAVVGPKIAVPVRGGSHFTW